MRYQDIVRQVNILLFGDEHFNHNNNLAIFIAVQKFIFESKCFKS